MDKIKFAILIAYIQRMITDHQHLQLSFHEINEIDALINDANTSKPYADDINALIEVMAQGSSKIEAIKFHRSLTGYGLKESKDIIDRYWVSK